LTGEENVWVYYDGIDTETADPVEQLA
jgi:hypothetical protein